MRTTLNLDEDVAEAARSLARDERRSLGQVVSELARRGLAPDVARLADENGFPVFVVEAGAPAITDEDGNPITSCQNVALSMSSPPTATGT